MAKRQRCVQEVLTDHEREVLAGVARKLTPLVCRRVTGERPLLYEAEREALRLVLGLVGLVTGEVVEQHREEQEGLRCEVCGEELERVGERERELKGWGGEVKLREREYRCRRCRRSFFP